ncbi:hypothetical protein PRIPAC_97050 [Pristionchus pacificus]|uniref:Cytochrome P450 n=1 Tax=Pristionchus pacificus TaxID=54126 RepID=A0A2A6D221_PRIPA|nr:hypothetical protein PRIPAC_97050 [Pristionchus pacificus]|eukprot:PDM84455.1 cytochrome P450 [Pristionchus pacificus]
MLGTLFLGGFGVLVYFIFRYYRYVSLYPAGPVPLPFIGNLHKIDVKAFHSSLQKYGEEFKGVYTVFMPIPYVQINDYNTLKEAFIENGDDFIDRPVNKSMQETLTFAPYKGVTFSNGDNWIVQRRTALSILRDFGMGKNVMEEKVMVGNIINEVLFGFRYKDAECAPLMEYVSRSNELLDSFADSPLLMLGMGFPILTELPIIGWYTLGRYKAVAAKAILQISAFVVANVDKTLENYHSDDEPTCFVQAYKQRMESNEFLDLMNLYGCCADFFNAGQETTTITLLWAVLLFAKHADIQEKLRSEVFSVVGKDRLPVMADQSQMIFARACVLELQRVANIISMNGPKVTSRDVVIRGKKIPAGTWVNGDIHYLLCKDPVFENPEEFQPERYIAADGKSLRKELVERTVPFSIGKRACAGEALARVELFLGLTSTFQHFRISARPGQIIDFHPIPGGVIRPKHQTLRVEKV